MAKKHPRRIALREKELGIWREYTWHDYFEHVTNFAFGLLELGLEAGSKIALLSDNSPRWLFADMGIQMAQGVTVGIYPTASQEDVKYMMRDSEAGFCIVGDQGQLDKVLSIKHELPLLSKIVLIDTRGIHRYKDPMLVTFDAVEASGKERTAGNPQGVERLLERQRAEDVSMLVYTSGTTGKPRAVKLTHENGICSADELVAANSITDADSLVSYLSLCYYAERLMSILLPLRTGCVVNFAESVETVGDALYEIAPTVLLFIPRMVEGIAANIELGIRRADAINRFCYRRFMSLAEKRARLLLGQLSAPPWMHILYRLGDILVFRKIKDRWGLKRVRLSYCGESAMDPALLSFFYAMGIKIREFYGATEFLGFTFCHQGNDMKLGTAGKPLGSTEYRLNDGGELLQRRKADRFAGYHGHDGGQEAASGDQGWINLEDRCSVDGDGNLVIIGRSAEIFQTKHGIEISPAKIENRLKLSPYIKEAQVSGEGLEYLSALIQIDFDIVADWAQTKGLVYTTFKTLAENPEVVRLIDSEVQNVNQDLPLEKRIGAFRLLPKELDQADGELTPTYKLKRHVIKEHFAALLGETSGLTSTGRQ